MRRTVAHEDQLTGLQREGRFLTGINPPDGCEEELPRDSTHESSPRVRLLVGTCSPVDYSGGTCRLVDMTVNLLVRAYW